MLSGLISATIIWVCLIRQGRRDSRIIVVKTEHRKSAHNLNERERGD